MALAKVSTFIYPEWPAPENVQSISTTRLGGVSCDVYAANNLALHVGDDKTTVIKNRQRLMAQCDLSATPAWLTQTHSNRVVDYDEAVNSKHCEADAVYSHHVNQPCVIMTADCLPILLCDKQGRQVAAIHAGWRGLLNNVIENGLARFQGVSGNIMAWIGPAIGKRAFEVGGEVYSAFVERHQSVAPFFQVMDNNRYLADLVGLAKLRLELAGLTDIYGGQYCTYTDARLFFSYRRDGPCGRMASLIWLDK